jgi:DNA polymerase
MTNSSPDAKNEDTRRDRLREIRDEVLGLSASPLYHYRRENNYFPVIGEGNHYARIVFIGEAPGQNEAKTGKPFCGAAGKILDELLLSIGLSRKDVYVTNILKDRPPKNRDPLPDEITIYAPFLDRQLNIICPEIIITLGRYSMGYIFKQLGMEDKLSSISKMHGEVFSTVAPFGTVTVVPLYHPAVALYNRETKKILLADMAKLKPLLV